jgi:hypothetical protein
MISSSASHGWSLSANPVEDGSLVAACLPRVGDHVASQFCDCGVGAGWLTLRRRHRGSVSAAWLADWPVPATRGAFAIRVARAQLL